MLLEINGFYLATSTEPRPDGALPVVDEEKAAIEGTCERPNDLDSARGRDRPATCQASNS